MKKGRPLQMLHLFSLKLLPKSATLSNFTGKISCLNVKSSEDHVSVIQGGC